MPFLGALAGCSARISERHVAGHTSEEQRLNAPGSAAKMGYWLFPPPLVVIFMNSPTYFQTAILGRLLWLQRLRIRAVRALRPARVNFHSNGRAMLLEVALEIGQPLGNRRQAGEVVWGQYLALHDGEVDFDLVEPTRVHRAVCLRRL